MKRFKVVGVFAFVFFLVSCSKEDTDDPVLPVDNDAFKQEAVTEVAFYNIQAGSPTEIDFLYRSTTLKSFHPSSTGDYRIEFHGKNGRPMLEGSTREPIIGDIAIWAIPIGDTFRVFKNGLKYRDFVTESANNNLLDGIVYNVLPGQTAIDIRTSGNNFTAPGGPMSSTKYTSLP